MYQPFFYKNTVIIGYLHSWWPHQRNFHLFRAGADTGKKLTFSKFPGFPILSNISPIFHNVSPIFHWQNFSRFASANVAVVWIRAWLYFTISYFLKTFLLNLFSETFSFKFKQNQCFFKLMFIKYKYYFLFLDIVTLKDDSYCF